MYEFVNMFVLAKGFHITEKLLMYLSSPFCCM